MGDQLGTMRVAPSERLNSIAPSSVRSESARPADGNTRAESLVPLISGVVSSAPCLTRPPTPMMEKVVIC